jgi:tetratricopeptide (TPR) repeat protein
MADCAIPIQSWLTPNRATRAIRGIPKISAMSGVGGPTPGRSRTANSGLLTKANDDLDKAVEQYGQAKGNLDQQLRAQKAYDEEKGEVIENAVGDDKDEVDAAWDWVRRKLADLHEKREQYWEALNAATDEYTKKQRPVVTAQTNFDELKGRQADLLQRLKDIADLQKRIAAAEDESDAVKMYALLLEFRKRLGTVDQDLVVVREYREELYKAWRELSDAQEAFRAAGEARTQAQQDYDETKAELAELEAGRVEAVLKRIPAPPADAAPAQ